MKTLDTVNLTLDEQRLIVSLINNFGSGDHAAASTDTLNEFSADYFVALVQHTGALDSLKPNALKKVSLILTKLF